jgi:hypothetical protein
LQAGRADFAQVSGFDLQFWLCHVISVQRFAWKEGTPGWAGTAAFSLKKATPKHFRLEVYPFFFRQSVEHRFYAPRSFAVGRFCFAGKWGTVSRRSQHFFMCSA